MLSFSQFLSEAQYGFAQKATTYNGGTHQQHDPARAIHKALWDPSFKKNPDKRPAEGSSIDVHTATNVVTRERHTVPHKVVKWIDDNAAVTHGKPAALLASSAKEHTYLHVKGVGTFKKGDKNIPKEYKDKL